MSDTGSTDVRPRRVCPWCNTTGTLFIARAAMFIAQPVGTWSLSGQQTKTVGTWRQLPALVCRNCRTETLGWIDDAAHVAFNPDGDHRRLDAAALADRDQARLREIL